VIERSMVLLFFVYLPQVLFFACSVGSGIWLLNIGKFS